MAVDIIIAACLTVYVAYSLVVASRQWFESRKLWKARRCEEPPRERPWDLLGVIKTYQTISFLLRGEVLASMTSSFNRYGETYSTVVAANTVLITCHPQNIRQILSDRFNDYDASKGVRDHLFKPLMDSSIFALDGPAWKSARAMFRGVFSNTRAITDMQMFERVFHAMLEYIPADGAQFDFQQLSNKYTHETMMFFVLGETSGVFDPNQKPEDREFLGSLHYVKAKIAKDGFLGGAHIFTSKKKFHSACAYLQCRIDRIVEQNFEERKRMGDREKRDNEQPYCLLESLKENSNNVKEVRDALLTVLVAGIDSVSSLLSATFWLLVRHPLVYDKLRQALLTTIGNKAPPTYEQIKAMSYLRYVLYESK